MRKILAAALFLTLAAIVIPVLSVLTEGDKKPEVQELDLGPKVKVLNSESGQVMTLPLEEYLVGVVAAEMPAAFPAEALKAQAAAARTYTLRRMETGSSPDNPHPRAHVCTDFNHCQAWIDNEEMARRWGKAFDSNLAKIRSAVFETAGLAIYYNNALIDPVYHSTSNGRTENSEDVWGSRMPYLRSVASTWDRQSPKFRTSVEVPVEAVTALGGAGAIQQVSTGGDRELIRGLEYTSTGRLKTVQIAGRTISSIDLRKALNLPSTDLTWKVSGEKVIFRATGSGHGVGMSQYGARGMAEEGRTFEEILKHYYTGVEVKAAY